MLPFNEFCDVTTSLHILAKVLSVWIKDIKDYTYKKQR